ncbi:MAG: phosphoribosylformylglycinamidine synthase subunit PurQ [Candidatus Methanospirareceae archaeon]
MVVRVCVLRIEGTNCEYETYLAFKRVGAFPEIVHLKQLIGAVKEKERRRLRDYDLLVIPGGFSAGDYVRAGAIFAARIKGALREEIEEFIDFGKPILGICNGFQVLVEMGLLPGFERGVQQVALTTNDSNRFECRPTLLKHENRGKCIFTRKIERGRILKMPCAHAEGKFFIEEAKRETYIKLLEENDQIVFRYVDPEGNYASYPWNPNGSVYNIAGICDPEGNIFGLMPHPERAFFEYMSGDWTRKRGRRGCGGEGKGEKEEWRGDGELIFESVVEYLSQ